MRIETYTAKYSVDVLRLIDNFYNESIQTYDIGFSKDRVIQTVTNLKQHNAGNAFLLIINDRCEGILAGIEMPALLNTKRTFQEVVWYINEPFRKYGVRLLKKVQAMLQAGGFETMIMGVLENSKTEKIKRLYEHMGFTLFESQYIKGLS